MNAAAISARMNGRARSTPRVSRKGNHPAPTARRASAPRRRRVTPTRSGRRSPPRRDATAACATSGSRDLREPVVELGLLVLRERGEGPQRAERGLVGEQELALGEGGRVPTQLGQLV